MAGQRQHVLAAKHAGLAPELSLERAPVHLRITGGDHEQRALWRIGVVEAERLGDPRGLSANLRRRELDGCARLFELENGARPAVLEQVLAGRIGAGRRFTHRRIGLRSCHAGHHFAPLY